MRLCDTFSIRRQFRLFKADRSEIKKTESLILEFKEFSKLLKKKNL